MNYPFENDTSAVIKKLARKSVRFDKKKKLILPFGNYCSRCYDNDVVAHSAKYHLSKSERNRRITSRDFL